jgi:hypothetical protein
MKFPIFASFIVLIIWLKYEIGKSNRKKDVATSDFWNKENEANSVRKKSLDNLPYIEIPYDLFPQEIMADNAAILTAAQTMERLRDRKMVNLSGITNTELKLTYGTANITPLSEYDQNYTDFTIALYQWGSTLYEHGYQTEAVPMLEFGIASGTDISGFYRLLYDYYTKTNDKNKIDRLREAAERLDSAMKNSIIRLLLEDVQTD